MAEALSQAVEEPQLRYDVLSHTRQMLMKMEPGMADDLSDAEETIFSEGFDAYHNSDFKKA